MVGPMPAGMHMCALVPSLPAALVLLAAAGLLTFQFAAPPRAHADLAAGFSFSQGHVVASHLRVPWGLAFMPDRSALVSERGTAHLLRVRPGQPPDVLGTVPNAAPNASEGGLLGLALSPNFVQDRWMYEYMTTATDNRIVRFHLNAARSTYPPPAR
jgi:glucose/arabinose dehydrogenase